MVTIAVCKMISVLPGAFEQMERKLMSVGGDE